MKNESLVRPQNHTPYPSEPPHTLTTNLLPTNHNSTTTPHQPKASQTTPCALKPYDNMLELDGKLKLEALECRHKNTLCLACGSVNHSAIDSPTSNQQHPLPLHIRPDPTH